ncbi:MAG: hypothetical protein HFI99_07165, partial [Lachnospiraceae bacterium]|nr:hypothetical protein [Lachnospiraceae bacterium]
MVQRILLKGCYLNGKSVMKKAVMTMIMGAALLTFSSCGQAKNSEDAQKTQNDNITGSDLAELENLTGEYEYLSDYGTGKLMIQKSSNGYDISDYESE